MTDIPVMPDITRATDAATRRLHTQMKHLVRRIATRALANNHDILFSVYVAGLYHGAELTKVNLPEPPARGEG